MNFLRQSMAGSIEAAVRDFPRKSPIISPAEALIVPAHIVAERRVQRAAVAALAWQADVAADAAEERDYARIDAERHAHNQERLEDVARVTAMQPGIMQRARGWARELLFNGVLALGALGAGVVIAAEPAPVGVEASAAGAKIADAEQKVAIAEPMIFDGHVSGVANSPGLSDSVWLSDAYFHSNARVIDHDLLVELDFVRKGASPAWPYQYVTLRPGETHTVKDIVGSLFQDEGVGVLYYRVLQGNPSFLTVNANTYNVVNPREQFGQQITGLRMDAMFPAGSVVYLPAPVDLESYRANLSVTAGPNCRNFTIKSLDVDGETIKRLSFGVASQSWFQRNMDEAFIGPGNPGMYFSVTCSDGPFAASISLVNNVTQDGNNIDARSVAGMEEVIFFGGVAYARGANSSNWQSNLELLNPNEIHSSSELLFLPRGQDNSGALIGQDFGLVSNQGLVIPNVLDVIGVPKGNAGSLLVKLDPAAPSIPFLQTPNVLGIDDRGWTTAYGQNIPGITPSESIQGDLEGVITGIVHNVDFRANAIYQNTRVDAVTGELLPQSFDVELLTPEGVLAHVAHYNLRPGEVVQVNNVVEEYLGEGATLEGGTMVVRARPDGNIYAVGGVSAGVSVVNGNDDRQVGTGDGRLIQHNLIEKANFGPDRAWCLDNLTVPYGACDSDSNGILDGVMRVRAGVTNEFSISGVNDYENDSVIEMFIEESGGTLPDYITIIDDTMFMSPGLEHLGDEFSANFYVRDHHGAPSEPSQANFRILQ